MSPNPRQEMVDLEETFLELIQQQAHKSTAAKQQIEKDRKEALAAAAQVSRLLEERLNAGVREVFMNQKRIEAETRAVALTVHKSVKQTQQWNTLFHAFDSALKEIGDFENWINIMADDCDALKNALERIKH